MNNTPNRDLSRVLLFLVLCTIAVFVAAYLSVIFNLDLPPYQ